jgi:hypothetical protein
MRFGQLRPIAIGLFATAHSCVVSMPYALAGEPGGTESLSELSWELHLARRRETPAGTVTSIKLVLIRAGFGTLLQVLWLFWNQSCAAVQLAALRRRLPASC